MTSASLPVPLFAAARTDVRRRFLVHPARAALALVMLGGLASAVPPVRHAPDAGRSRLAIPVSPPAAFPGGAKPILPLPPSDAVLLNAARGFEAPPVAAPGFRFGLGATERERAVECLAAAAWYEAGDDPTGQRAVAQVVLNRVRHPSYPKSVCGVVFEGSDRQTGCQFTFTCDGALVRRAPGEGAWKRARAIATAALDGAVDPAVGTATHYHADYVVPRWAANLTKLAQVGAHIFYRFPGYWGERSVLRAGGSLAEPPMAGLARLSTLHAVAAPGPGESGAAMPLADAAGLALPQGAGGFAPAPAKPGAILLAVDPQGPAGRWALDAIRRCTGLVACQVVAWGSTLQLEANRNRPGEARDRPMFLFVRDASGMQVALWDCSAVQRPDPAQCLPDDPAALRRLLRDRG